MQNQKALQLPPIDARARAEMRASYAGETGAVWIYRGIILISYLKGDESLRKFAENHLTEELRHLALYEAQIHRFRGSMLQAGWMLAGFLIGAFPALINREWVYYTIWIVESFVDKHYEYQIKLLAADEQDCAGYTQCLRILKDCHVGEIVHKKEALAAMSTKPSAAMKKWGQLIAFGSQTAVSLARAI